MSASALYEGTVFHRRHAPARRFRYPVWMALLDLDELPAALDRHPLWSARRPAPVRLRARDHLPGDGPLADRARAVVAEHLAVAPAGPVRILATPRVLGTGFNPVTFTYVHHEDSSPAAVIAEVTNTPWGERHRYVAPWRASAPSAWARFEKRMHVSPFMPMNQTYELEAGRPGESLAIAIVVRQGGRPAFEARLQLHRRELNRAEMTRMLIRHAGGGAATLARIYGQALRMWREGIPRYPHPAGEPPAA
jgi:DUF1365 family protein